ncbi:hypothetical protein [Paenarthrobacter sp. A20]|uniref:hypothetical protein n=1 Tax=Paenarthrobacter sp. A20 TaxID=2817891 RepID=UPI0020A06F15|nr:hypothetical protein [Paenarthrobacter sp. A20]MCP1415516.1 hypothetical protein [Paenarthrobacter sp. A20]
MRKHWKLLTALGAVILVIAVAVVLLNPPAPAAKQDDPSSLQASGKFGFPVSGVKIGEGGTKTASDGKTITGYNGSCDSAAQAAANYAHLLRDVNVKTWAQQKKVLSEVSKPGPWTVNATIAGEVVAGSKDLPPGAFADGWFIRSDVPAGGMYRIASCDEKKKAVVQVFVGSLDAQTQTVPVANFGTLTMELGWDEDWKITDAMPRVDDPDFGGRVKDKGPVGSVAGDPTGSIPTLTSELVDSLFKDTSHEGWVEYANAKR